VVALPALRNWVCGRMVIDQEGDESFLKKKKWNNFSLSLISYTPALNAAIASPTSSCSLP